MSSQPVTLASSASNASLPQGMIALGGAEVEALKAQLQQGNLNGLREYLARTRAEKDWADRVFLLPLVVAEIRVPVLDFACDVEPEAADLFVIRAAFFADLAATMRGSGTCDKVGAERFKSAADCVKAMMEALGKVAQLDKLDPTAFAVALPAMTIFSELAEPQRKAFQHATALAPDLAMAYRPVVTRFAKRWGGSHEDSVNFARQAVERAGYGSDAAVCLFWAHLMAQTHARVFDNKPFESDEYLKKPEVREELAQAFDRWTAGEYAPRRSSVPMLHHAACWFFLVKDAKRLGRALELIGDVYCPVPWNTVGNAMKMFEDAKLIAVGQTPAAAKTYSAFGECIGMVLHGLDQIRAKDAKSAERAIAAALIVARSAQEQSEVLVPLAQMAVSVLQQAIGKKDDSRNMRELAEAALVGKEVPESAEYARAMATLLRQLQNWKLAIVYLEKAIALGAGTADALKMAEMLWHLGESYNLMGLHDHGLIPMQASVKTFRAYPQDPRLPSALLSLGNALRKNRPDEAEAVFNEIAEWYLAKVQPMAASRAWVNLGVLCGEQGRNEESLAYYEKALRVREQTKGVSAADIARVQSNMANAYRRMGRFKEAQSMVDRALKIASSDAAVLAAAYGTKGETYFDAHEDKKAVEWLHKAYVERKKQASPDLSGMSEMLEKEITALERLGKTKDVAEARARLDAVQAARRAVPQTELAGTEGKAPQEGSVQVELAYGSRETGGFRDAKRVAERLHREARTQGVGSFSGSVVLPESTTLIFYGNEAEVLFAALEPALMSEQECAGARVMIRQGAQLREVVMATEATAVN